MCWYLVLVRDNNYSFHLRSLLYFAPPTKPYTEVVYKSDAHNVTVTPINNFEELLFSATWRVNPTAVQYSTQYISHQRALPNRRCVDATFSSARTFFTLDQSVLLLYCTQNYLLCCKEYRDARQAPASARQNESGKTHCRQRSSK